MRMFEFVYKHIKLCRKAFYHGRNYEDFRTTPGLKLVNMARKELGYSDHTYSGDIFRSIALNYEKLYP